MLRRVFDILDKVYRQHTFVGLALNAELVKSPNDHPSITSTVYGVLEYNATLEYYIRQLCSSRPKPVICVILKIGLYLLMYSNTPDYAAVSSVVNLTKEIGKGAQSGFINATLKRFGEVTLPTEKLDKLSIYSGKPRFWIDRIIKDYGEDIGKKIISAKVTTDTHVRFFRDFDKIKCVNGAKKTRYGMFVDAKELKNLQKKYLANPPFCVQGLGSCYIASCAAFEDKSNNRLVLDACAAPGGKSIFIHQNTDSKVVACDIYPHRIDLIKKNVASHKLTERQVETKLQDATTFNSDWVEKFDCVLADVPCSGSGVVWSKPDILLEECDLSALSSLQLQILTNCAKYVSINGLIVYATCSLHKCENENVIERFLDSCKDSAHKFVEVKKEFDILSFKQKYGTQFLPIDTKCEGFYVCVLKKAEEKSE